MLWGKGLGLSSTLIFNIQETKSIQSVVMDNSPEKCEKILALNLKNHKNLKGKKI
jgi:hypothetical protein